MASFWAGLGARVIPQSDVFCREPRKKYDECAVHVGHFLWSEKDAAQYKDAPKFLLVRDPRYWLIARYRQIMRGVGGMAPHRKHLLSLSYENRLIAIIHGFGVKAHSARAIYETRFQKWFEQEPCTFVAKYETLGETLSLDGENLLKEMVAFAGWRHLLPNFHQGVERFSRIWATYDPFEMSDQTLPPYVREEIESETSAVMALAGYKKGQIT